MDSRSANTAWPRSLTVAPVSSMRRTRLRSRAFSLVEVVIAVGIFAGAVAIVLALLPSIGRQAAASGDSLVAQRFPDALGVELRRLATGGGFDALVARAPVASAPLDGGLAFVASRDGARLHSLDYLAPAKADALPEAEHYFLVEVWRFPSAPLAYDPRGAVLPLMVRVSWPFRALGPTATIALADRSQLTFNTAISR